MHASGAAEVGLNLSEAMEDRSVDGDDLPASAEDLKLTSCHQIMKTYYLRPHYESLKANSPAETDTERCIKLNSNEQTLTKQ